MKYGLGFILTIGFVVALFYVALNGGWSDRDLLAEKMTPKRVKYDNCRVYIEEPRKLVVFCDHFFFFKHLRWWEKIPE